MGLVLIANVIGTWGFAAVLAFARPFHPDIEPALTELAKATTAESFRHTAIGAVFSGWLIALMVWLLPSAGSARFWVVIFIAYVVAISRLPHIIAGSGEAAYAVLTGVSRPWDYLTAFFAPTLLGNCLGGTILAALINHAPVADRVRRE